MDKHYCMGRACASPYSTLRYAKSDLDDTVKTYYSQGQYVEDSWDGEYPYRYAKKDHLGSVRELTPFNYAYDEYGNELLVSSTSSSSGDVKFTGHLFNNQSGLYLAPYRVYDPQIGRWLSREPFGLDGPNLYHYVFANPIGMLDPLGLWAINVGGNVGGSFGGGSFQFEGGIIIDGHGNVGFYVTEGVGGGIFGGGLKKELTKPWNLGAATVVGAADYDNIWGACGVSTNFSGSVGPYQGSYSKGSGGQQVEVGLGPGTGAGFSAMPTNTQIWDASDFFSTDFYADLIEKAFF